MVDEVLLILFTCPVKPVSQHTTNGIKAISEQASQIENTRDLGV